MAEPSRQDATALLVTADETTAMDLARALDGRGFSLLRAESTREALALLSSVPVNVAVIDAELPRDSGFDLAREAHRHGHGAALIVVTSVMWPQPRRAAAIRQMGLLGLLSKPVDPEAVAALACSAAPPARRACPAPEQLLDAPGSPPSWHGSLAVTPFPFLLRRLSLERATGALLLQGDRAKKIVYTSDGLVTDVRSNLVAECLGMVLVREGLITGAACRESLARMEQTGEPQGAILQEMRAISPRDLAVGLQLQLKTKLLETFTWTRGEFAFRFMAVVPRSGVVLDWSVGDCIASGIRYAYDRDRLASALSPHADRALGPSPDPSLRFQEVTLDPDERALIDALDGTRTLREVLSDAVIPEARAMAAAYIAIAAGLVEA